MRQWHACAHMTWLRFIDGTRGERVSEPAIDFGRGEIHDAFLSVLPTFGYQQAIIYFFQKARKNFKKVVIDIFTSSFSKFHLAECKTELAADAERINRVDDYRASDSGRWSDVAPVGHDPSPRQINTGDDKINELNDRRRITAVVGFRECIFSRMSVHFVFRATTFNGIPVLFDRYKWVGTPLVVSVV